MSGTVLVTGATGFIGRPLCAALVSEGFRVRGLLRSTTSGLPAGVEPAPAADLQDAPAITKAMQGVKVVIHLAGRAHVMRESDATARVEYQRVNVAGTKAMVEAAIAAGAERFLLASSVKAVADSSELPLTEHTPPAPPDAYGASKLAAEQVVRSASAGIGATVLRFPLVYGPGMRANMLRLFRLVDRGIPLPFAAVHNQRSLLYTGNLTAACLTVLRSPATSGETLFVSDGRDVSTPELLRLIGIALGRPARLWPVPPAAFRVLASVAAARELDRLLGSLVVDSTRLTALTGFHPPYTLEAGLEAAAAWYRRSRAAA